MGQCMGSDKQKKYKQNTTPKLSIPKNQAISEKGNLTILGNQSQVTSAVPMILAVDGKENFYDHRRENGNRRQTLDGAKYTNILLDSQIQTKKENAEEKIRHILSKDQKLKKVYEMVNNKLNKPQEP